MVPDRRVAFLVIMATGETKRGGLIEGVKQ